MLATVCAALTAAFTVMLLLTRLGDPVESATMIVCDPAVFSVKGYVPAPAVRFRVPVGKTAFASVEVKVIGPV